MPGIMLEDNNMYLHCSKYKRQLREVSVEIKSNIATKYQASRSVPIRKSLNSAASETAKDSMSYSRSEGRIEY